MQTNTSAIEKRIFADNYLAESETDSEYRSEAVTIRIIDENHPVTRTSASNYHVLASLLGSFSIANVGVGSAYGMEVVGRSIQEPQRKVVNLVRLPASARPDSIPTIITENWQQIYRANLSEESYLELLNLASKNDGWRGEGSKALSSGSFTVFLDFWSEIKDYAEFPEFTLTPNGNLQAEWYKNNTHFVEIEFLPNRRALFGIFDGKTIIEGEESIVELLSSITASSKSKRRFTWSSNA